MTRLTPHTPSSTGAEQPSTPSSMGPVVSDPATAWTPCTRRVAVVVALLLLVHVLAVLALLFVARSAAAETDAKRATLPWAFPKVNLAAERPGREVPTSAPPPANTLARTIPTAAWQPPSSRDVPAPWHTDSQGHITWTH